MEPRLLDSRVVKTWYLTRILGDCQQAVMLLALETSCDETAVALYGRRGLLGHRIQSQADLHARFGGVVPELAARDHTRDLLPLIRGFLEETGTRVQDLTAVAATSGPGLPGALHVAHALGQSVAFARGIPFLGVHHLEAHIFSGGLGPERVEPPFVALVVSGGHTELVAVEALGRYRLLGATRDDAAGEAFDKAALLLGLPYPGGPALSRLALTGDPERFDLPRPMLDQDGCEMSFSGLKTALLYTLRALRNPTQEDHADLAAAYQAAIVDVLTEKSFRALAETGSAELVVCGGVSANPSLRRALQVRGRRAGVRVVFPPLEFCTDNAAMIAHVAWLRLAAGERTGNPVPVRTRWPLTDLAPPGDGA